jgi:4-hydroxybenzoate polyprenyltransferase
LGTTVLATKLVAISDLIRLPKQYGTALLLFPALWALFLASEGTPEPRLLVIFTLGAFIMRSAGCTINDIADRDFDRRVERTKSRPLADGRLTVKEALAVFGVLSTLAFLLVLLLNPLTILLAFIGITLAATYPLIKRVSFFPQAFLGIAFGWGAIMAWAAVTGGVGLVCVLLFITNIFWSTAYDTIYALMDIEDDIKVGVRSTAIYFGRYIYFATAMLYVGVFFTLGLVGLASGLGPFYYAGITLTLILFMSILFKLKKNPTREEAMRGFLANTVAGALVLVSIIVDLNVNI